MDELRERAASVTALYSQIKWHDQQKDLWQKRDPVSPRAFPTIKASLAQGHCEYASVEIPNPVYTVLRQAMLNHHEAEIDGIKARLARALQLPADDPTGG